MWISRKEYDKLIEKNTRLNQKVREQGLRIADLLEAVDNLAIQLHAQNDKCYEVTIIARGSKKIQYTLSAISHDNAYEIAVEWFEKDNLNYSKEDILAVKTREI
jgi:histone deacetylase complex regulatory component SIN3